MKLTTNETVTSTCSEVSSVDVAFTDYGVMAGAGLRFERVRVGGHYDAGLRDVVTRGAVTMRNRAWVLVVEVAQ